MPYKNEAMLTGGDGPHDTVTQLGFTTETARLMLTMPLRARLPAPGSSGGQNHWITGNVLNVWWFRLRGGGQ